MTSAKSPRFAPRVRTKRGTTRHAQRRFYCARAAASTAARATGRNSAEADDDAVAVDGWKPLLPAQWFDAKYIGHETAIVFNAPKVFLHFEIVQHGEHLGKCLFRAFRARKLVGRPCKGGKFVAHANGELYLILAWLLDVKLRADRIHVPPVTELGVPNQDAHRHHRLQTTRDPRCVAV